MRVERDRVFDVFHYLIRSGSVLCALDGIDEAVPESTLDGFLALFGAPVAHEDHARRAVLAALELHQRLRACRTSLAPSQDAPLAVGIGLHSGPVVVGYL